MLRSSKRLNKQKCMRCNAMHSACPWLQVDIIILFSLNTAQPQPARYSPRGPVGAAPRLMDECYSQLCTTFEFRPGETTDTVEWPHRNVQYSFRKYHSERTTLTS